MNFLIRGHIFIFSKGTTHNFVTLANDGDDDDIDGRPRRVYFSLFSKLIISLHLNMII
jgi:hypothetical protein